MLSKSQIKLINSLSQKKFRTQQQLFVVEGVKGVNEFLKSEFKLHQLFTTEAIFDCEHTLITDAELKKISSLKSPNTVLAIFHIPEVQPVDSSGLVVALDDVRDPGNLGTIIRLCDWFGIKNLVCSLATVDCYNTKVIQATMGSLTRVTINYLDLEAYLKSNPNPKMGTFMDGDNVYQTALPKQGVLVMGNEGNGISKVIENCITTRVSIPRFGNLQATESLNVATATAIFLSELKR